MRAVAHAAVVVVVVVAGLAVAGCGIDPNNLPQMTFDVKPEDSWPATELAPAPAPGEGRIYVTDNLDDTISIIDLDSADAGQPVLLAKIPVGFVPVEREGPHHVIADKNGEFYYFGISNFVPGSGSGPHGVHGAGTIDGHMVKMRVSDNTVVAESRVEPNPGDVRLTPDGKTLLASHFDLAKVTKAIGEGITSGPDLDSSLAIIDPTDMSRPTLVETCPAAHGIAVTADSGTAVTSCFDDRVAVVDLADPAHPVDLVTVLAQPGDVSGPVCQPYAITIDDDAGVAWVSCFTSGQLIGVDIATRTLTGQSFQLNGVAVFGEIRDGTFVVASQNAAGGDAVNFLDVSGETPTSLGTAFMNPNDCLLPHVAKFNEDASKVFVVCEGDHADPGSFVVIDAAPPHATLGKVELGIFPDDIAAMRVPQ